MFATASVKIDEMNVAEYMVQCLEAEDVRYIFGVPGEENEDLLFALEKSDIEFVPVRHEQGGAFIANVWGRLSGKAGVCLSTLGPGATNLLTGLADANLDKAPVVAITGQGGLARSHHESHQMLNVVDMMKPITKWNAAISSPETVSEVVRKAFKLAEYEKPGVCHIELPEDLAAQLYDGVAKPIAKSMLRLPAPDSKSVNAAVQMLTAAKRPLILAGNGAIRQRASAALTDFARSHHIPVATSFMGKGAISDKNELCLGAVGLGFKDYVIEAFEEADLVMCIGYDIAEHDPAIWNPDRSQKIIHIDFEMARVFMHYEVEVELIADIATAIQALDRALGSKKYDDYTSSIRERIRSSINDFRLTDTDTIFTAPGVVHAVRDVVDDDAVLISDVGSHKMWIARQYQTYCPNGAIISNGMASMGISLPGGIAASLLDKDRTVVSVMGDGGALMNIQELETAVRLGVSCIFIILNDNNYGLIQWKQEMSDGKHFGTALGNPDFVALGKSFGIDSYKPESVGHFKELLADAIDKRRLTLFEIPIDTEVNDQLTEELIIL